MNAKLQIDKARCVPFAEKFASSVVCHGDPDACWPWIGYSCKGYVRVRTGGKNDKKVGVHVATYRFFKGEIPLMKWFDPGVSSVASSNVK